MHYAKNAFTILNINFLTRSVRCPTINEYIQKTSNRILILLLEAFSHIDSVKFAVTED